MKGLMQKEFSLLTRGTGLLMAIASILFAVSGGLKSDTSIMNSMAFLYISLGTMSVMELEEKWKWDKMLLCAPAGRLRMVGAKYLTVFLQLLLNLGIFAAVNLLVNGGQALALGVQQCGLGFVTAALMLTLAFWLGTDGKGVAVIGMLIIFVLIFGGNTALLRGLESVAQVSWTMAGLTMAGGLILYGLSLPLAGWLYERREK